MTCSDDNRMIMSSSWLQTETEECQNAAPSSGHSILYKDNVHVKNTQLITILSHHDYLNEIYLISGQFID